MELSERSIRIKELISGQLDMGTFGLVELELIEFDKDLNELKETYLPIVSHSCKFKQYGDEERLCSKCGYVIGVKGEVNKQLEYMINNGYSIPSCGVNNTIVAR